MSHSSTKMRTVKICLLFCLLGFVVTKDQTEENGRDGKCMSTFIQNIHYFNSLNQYLNFSSSAISSGAISRKYPSIHIKSGLHF